MGSQHLKNIHLPPLPFDPILPICVRKKRQHPKVEVISHILLRAANWEWDV